jgi:hypothetical protein
LYHISNGYTQYIMFVTLVLLFVLFIYFMFIKDSANLAVLLFIFCILLEAFLFLRDWSKDYHYFINGIASSLLITIILGTIVLLLFFPILYLAKTIKLRIYYLRCPLSIIIYRLIFLIDALERCETIPISLRDKEWYLIRLEEVANCVEHYVPSGLKSRDFITDNWTKETTKRIAAAIRNKKKWILTPKSDTREYILQSMTFALTCFIYGNWDALEQIEPEKLSSPQLRHSIFTFLINLLRIILIGVLPLVSVWLFQQTPFAFTGIGREYVIIGIFVWELLTLVFVLDPNLGVKISVMKDVTRSLFPPRTDNR